MKKITLILAVSCAFLLSCGKKKTTTEIPTNDTTQVSVKIDSLVFEVDTFSYKEKEKCTSDDCSSVDLYYEKIRLPLKPVHDSVNRYIDKMVLNGLNWMGGDEHKYDLKKRTEVFFASKREMEAQDNESGGAWDWEMNLNVFRPCNEIITVSGGWGGYTGGAHPNYESYTSCFFTSNGKMVTLADIFTDMAAVNKIGLKYFKKDNQLDPNVDCMEQGWDFDDNGFALNENFDINAESITWQFNSYEIGPYSAGAPSVTIPIKDLQKYMKVKFTDVVIQ